MQLTTDIHFPCATLSDRLAALITDVTADPHADLERFLGECLMLRHRLPQPLLRRLQAFARDAGEDGVLVLTGLPVERALPPTPASQAQAQGIRRGVSQALLATISAALGSEPVAYAPHLGGAVFQEVIPTPDEEYIQSSSGSRARLVFHTEVAFHRHPPDHVLLYCERPDPARKVATTFLGARRLLARLDPETLALLQRPLFHIGIDHSFGGPELPASAGLVTPILFGDADDPRLVYDEVMTGCTPHAQSALEHLAAIIAAEHRAEVLVEGSLMIIDNRRAVHGRAAFVPHHDGRDRWLRRIYAVRDLRSSASDRPDAGRVICSRFES